MLEPLEVRPLAGHAIWIRYSDGTAGEIDLSHLAGRGVFSLWDDRAAFEKVHIGPGRAIAWTDEVELCPDALYLRLTGKKPSELPVGESRPALAGA